MPPRDDRLDVWRGLCLIDVVLVHLAFNGLGFPGPLDEAIKHWTRFAAGGFVFLAGLTVAVAFGPAIARSVEARHRTYQRLWRRAGQLVLIELAASIVYRMLDPLRWFPSDPDTPLTDALVNLVLLRRPGVMGGILVLYAILLAAVPLLYEVRRRAGDWPVALASIGLYVAAVATGGALAWPDGEFHVAYWQPIFVAGLLSTRGFDWLRGRSERGLVAWALTATGAFAIVFLLQNGPSMGIEAPARLLPLGFDKKPLQPGALLWYLAIVQVVFAWTLLAWERVLRDSQASAWLALLGRHSLLFYVAHVFTEIPVMELVWNAWPPAGVRLALTIADLGVLMTLCAAAEGWLRLPAVSLPRLTRAATATALAGVCVTVLWTVVPERDLTFTDLEQPVTLEEWVQDIGPAEPPHLDDSAIDEPELSQDETTG
ncbi:MAG TPA: OpgC domain-containing protein [Candidatus Binatia bacterium]|jgi:hypothetical protein|nr:OpgC domain-containing protein [Candidatus Binatia bacterium]